MLADTHCHLDFPEFNPDRDEVIKRAKDQGIGYIINVGSSLDGSKKSIELARQYDFIYASVGIHPHEADKFDRKTQAVLADLAKADKVVAIGEIGLDYYRNYASHQNQKLLFTCLLKLAKNLGLPVIVHTREALQDTLEILKQDMPQAAVVHCFSGDENFLKQCLTLGFYVSFTCNITYNKADNLRNLLGITPLDRLLLETDAPFLAPQRLRGSRCEPAYVKYLAEAVAGIKNLSIEEVARVTTNNAKTFFKIG